MAMGAIAGIHFNYSVMLPIVIGIP